MLLPTYCAPGVSRPAPRRPAADGRRAARSAFTLVELLVIIAVIALLLSLLAPTARHLLIRADRTICASNLHQYSSAMHAYIPENRGLFPSCHSSGPVDVEHTWIGALYPYASNQELGHCPALHGGQEDHGVTWDWSWSGSHLGYGYNMWFLGGSHLDGRQGETGGLPAGLPRMYRDTKLISVLEPGRCIMFADSNPKVANNVDYGCTISLFWPYVHRYYEGINGSRHENAGVVCFVDGHVKTYLDPDDTINPPYDGAPHFIENWDHLQRRHLWGE